jgi:hypothetical protein
MGTCVSIFRSLVLATFAVVVAAAPAAAAPPKKPPPKSKSAAKPAAKPVAKPAAPAEPEVRVPPGGFMVPKVVVLKNPTLAEREANAVWNIRAALNVAALQCQFSPFLRTVKTYNSFLQAHSEELSRAQATMIGHFKRTDGAKALTSFDMYTTRTYNSYSTLDAQYAFCNAAGIVGRRALAVPKGKLGEVALAHGPEIRAALSYQALSPALTVVIPEPIAVPPLVPDVA